MKKTLLLFLLFLISCNDQKDLSNNFNIDIVKDGVIYEANIRQYSESGKFKDFTKDIYKLKDLGVKIIWLMPIHPISKTNRKGTLGSYYSISDYKAVNPEFGSKDDLDELIKEAHKHDMLVILDWVANHTGWDHKWIKNKPDYYTKNENGEITDPINPTTGESWGWTDVADLNFDNMEMQNEMIKAMEYWVKEYDIDGYRLDAAHSCPVSFWKKSIERLKKIKNVLMLAESDGYHTGGFELIELFDMSYNWSGHHVLNRIYKKENNSEDLKLNINRNLNDYSSKHILMNFTSNHDEYGLNKRLEFFEKDFIAKKQSDFYEFYSNLNSLKKENNILDIDSEIKFEIIETNNKNLICYKRTKNNDSMYFVANLSEESQEINTEFSETLKSLNSDKMISLKKNSLNPWEYHFLK